MIDMNYFKRLGQHGGRLVWRILIIFVPFVAYSIFNMLRSIIFTPMEDDYETEKPKFGYLDKYGTPEYSNTTDAQWEAYYNK